MTAVRSTLDADVADDRLVLQRAQSRELGSTREAVIETAVQRLDLSQKQAGEAYELAEMFVDVIAAPENRFASVYCHSGARAATMWLIKRVRQDGWPLERAMAEAESLGLSRPELKQFATEFLATR
ncbi:MAG: hypothetical protein JNM38_26025 [Acidobacteria bacterium]|nr:hypothetical protein [Acidobacteriota bacterium]